MKKILVLLLLLASVVNVHADFLDDQKQYKRVREAIAQKEQNAVKTLATHSLAANKLNILIVTYKAEDILEVWAKNKDEKKYKRIKSYQVCAKSGQLGPKVQQGDRQVPEGFYHIDRFNPMSNYHLSLGVNYPNNADRKRSQARNLGGDIFIHGSCVTIGCLPLTDDKIKEVYLYSVFAKNSGQNKIPVYIFPFKMSEQNIQHFNNKYKNKQQLLTFWYNLKQGYDQFHRDNQELSFSIDNKGQYLFKQ